MKAIKHIFIEYICPSEGANWNTLAFCYEKQHKYLKLTSKKHIEAVTTRKSQFQFTFA